MKRPFKRILYGGDYNPNQWGKEIWKEDMRIFKDARINSATINVFSWAKIQPSEEIYNFTELDEIIDMLSRENYCNFNRRASGMDGKKISGSSENGLRGKTSQIWSAPQCMPEFSGVSEVCIPSCRQTC